MGNLPYTNDQRFGPIYHGRIQGMGQHVRDNTFTSTTSNNFIFGLGLGTKAFIASFIRGSGVYNTHVGPEYGYDEKRVPEAYHTYAECFEQGNFEEALKLNNIACQKCENEFGQRQSHTIDTKRNRALILAHLKEYDEAMRDISETLDECKAYFPPGIPGDEITLKTMDTASIIHHMGGRHTLADLLSEQACREYEKHKEFGPDHPCTLSAMLRRALHLEEQGKRKPAKEMYEKAYEPLQKASGPPDLNAILIMYHRARHFESLENGQDKSNAPEAYTETVEACERFLKNDSKDEIVRAIMITSRDKIPI